MLRKLRRNSKDAVPPAIDSADAALRSLSLESMGESSTNDTSTTATTTTTRSGLTFFDLPAELRNAIYELVICDATLSLPCGPSPTSIGSRARLALKRRKQLPTPNINGLLLASRQCRQEYHSVLLSSIQITVEVKDFDFDQLIRVSGSLRETEAQTLQLNRNMTLLLDNRNCTTKDLAALRRWLDYRKTSGDQLPWKYEFPMLKHMPPSTQGRVRLMRELEYYADNVASVSADISDDQQEELQAVIAAFESKAMILEDSLGWHGQQSKQNPRLQRGLAGGGLM